MRSTCTKSRLAFLPLSAVTLAVAVSAAPAAAQKTEHYEFLSPVYEVDQKYKSMTGPQSTESLLLVESDELELLWITGYRATMVDASGKEAMPQEFMCHSNLDFDPTLHNRTFEMTKPISSRLFTLSQGQFEVQFPDGFGIPISSAESLNLTTQVLNLNVESEKPFDVRHKVEIDFVRDSALERPLRPLFVVGVYGLKDLEGGNPYFGRLEGIPEVHGPGCLAGDNATTHEYKDGYGHRFTGHWVVEPGREENHTLVTPILNLPWDSTVHYIAVHLHPFAESLELRDLTTGQTVYKSRARQTPDRIGLAHVDSYSSQEGLFLYKNHEYELISVYNNTTEEPQDSMAVMNLYIYDQEFEYPEKLEPPR